MSADRIQRRLAAILATDVVGYSRLMGDDEAGTVARLKTLRAELFDPATERHQGRIVKTTGDGALVEFGSAVDAVEHAIDIQQALTAREAELPEDRRIVLRIGINLGDVIVEGDDIYGDGVNVAARLEALAEPGAICLSGDVYRQVRGKLDAVFVDLGEQSVKNIAEPVHVYGIDLAAAATPGGATDRADTVLERHAVAVLPFTHFGGDPEQEYFADGLTEDIITALSIWRSFPVIARNSSFAYKGQSPDVRAVGKELGARYVLEGSVRRSGDRIRVTAQLIDAETGHHVWAERYDRQLDDIFDVQDEITERIAAIIVPTLEKEEFKRVAAKRPENLDAWDCCMRGMALVNEETRDGMVAARAMFERAIALDEGFGRAHAGMAYSHYRDVIFGFTDDGNQSLRHCMEFARRAVALDDEDGFAHNTLAFAFMRGRQFDLALTESRKAMELDPTGLSHIVYGTALKYCGRPSEGIPYLRQGLELTRKDPRRHVFMARLADAQLQSREYEQAADLAQAAVGRRSDFLEALLILVVSLGHLGHEAEAKPALEACRRVQPDFDEAIKIIWFYLDPDGLDHVREGLRKAGLAE